MLLEKRGCILVDNPVPGKFNVALRPQRPYGLLGDGEPRTATSTFAQLLNSVPGYFGDFLFATNAG